MNPNFIDSAVKYVNTFINGGDNWTNVQNGNYQNHLSLVKAICLHHVKKERNISLSVVIL